MRNNKNKIGIQNIMRKAETKFYENAQNNLSPERYSQMQDEQGLGLFVAGNYPSPEWEKYVGFVPENAWHYEVNIGIAKEPGESSDLFAKILISRDGEEDYCHIIWEP